MINVDEVLAIREELGVGLNEAREIALKRKRDKKLDEIRRDLHEATTIENLVDSMIELIEVIR